MFEFMIEINFIVFYTKEINQDFTIIDCDVFYYCDILRIIMKSKTSIHNENYRTKVLKLILDGIAKP